MPVTPTKENEATTPRLGETLTCQHGLKRALFIHTSYRCKYDLQRPVTWQYGGTALVEGWVGRECTFCPAVVYHGAGSANRHVAWLRAAATTVHGVQSEPEEDKKRNQCAVRYASPFLCFQQLKHFYNAGYIKLGTVPRQPGASCQCGFPPGNPVFKLAHIFNYILGTKYVICIVRGHC